MSQTTKLAAQAWLERDDKHGEPKQDGRIHYTSILGLGSISR